MYAPTDARVTRLILLNPWVRTSEGQAQAYLDRYYGPRLRSRLFWRKVFNGSVDAAIRAASGYLANLRTASREPEATVEADPPILISRGCSRPYRPSRGGF